MLHLADLGRRMRSLLAAAVLAGAATPAAAGTISNVADASWSVGSTRQATRSNEVSFSVGDPQVRVLTYVPLPGASSSLDLQSSYCKARAAAFATASAPGIISTPVVASSTVRAGQQVILKLQSAAANRDPAAPDVLDLVLVSATGDEERVRAVETGADTGEFLASITTVDNRPPIARGDCQLAVSDHTMITVRVLGSDGTTSYPVAQLEALADPFGIVFDSATGEPVDGARVTLVDQRTGEPALVYAFDGVTPYPATMLTGSTVLDASGRAYPMAPGSYQFPLAALGQYRLRVEPPEGFTAPSTVPAEQLAALPRPGGGSFALAPASYGAPFSLVSLDPLQVDIPVDGPGGELALRKTASRDRAQPGDTVIYRLTVQNRDPRRGSGALTLRDVAPQSMRLRPGSVRIGTATPPPGSLVMSGDGRGFTLQIPSIAGGREVTVTYAMSVRPDAGPGVAINSAQVNGSRSQATAQARLRIERSAIASRMTLVGRVMAGGCTDPWQVRGIAGVRLVLEDGSFAVTDAEGRYHFEGLIPGTHALQIQRHTLPKGSKLVDCTRSTASARSLVTRFVRGQGGSLAVADFHAVVPEGAMPDASLAGPQAVPAAGSTDAEPAATDWLKLGDGPDGFIAPAEDANPRSPAVRVAVRHRIGDQASLTVDGKPVDPLSFEGMQRDPAGRFAVSHWRGIHLDGAQTLLEAQVSGDGEAAQAFSRVVHFAGTPMQAELVPERSRLVADGTTSPIVAVRLRDRNGRPVRAGVSGAFGLQGPYRSASAAQAQRQQVLSGFGNAGARWTIEGDDGVALIELEPTLVSGSLVLDMEFSDGESRRKQELEAWIEPGEQPWTLIGLAEGSVGAQSIADAMERGDDVDSDLGENARVAFYAKGRVLGRYLLTLSYDSAKARDDQPLLGVIDPSAYYTIFADGSQRAFDAQSREKLYVRVESAAFYALYGDFLTGFVNTTLAHYQRAATGVKGEARFGQVQAQAFAARIASRHRRDEIQGFGLTGPYALSSRAVIPGSERVVLEVRDRLRPEVIAERRELVRFADYTLDLLTGSITLASPLAGRDAALNPQFLVIDYEVDEQGEAQWNGGIRGTWSTAGGALRIGASAISDRGDAARTNLGAVDLRLQIGQATELRAEAALSDGEQGTARAFSAELRHQQARGDVVAYARQIDDGFGVGQQNLADRGRRKLGVDGRLVVSESLSVIASGWLEQGLQDSASRKAAEVRMVRRTDANDMHAGVTHLTDSRSDGTVTSSTLVEAGMTQRMLGNRLEMSGSTSVIIGASEAIDLPSRHRLGARYAITPQVKALASYEVAHGGPVDSRSLQGGLEFSPIRGSRVVTTLGKQALGADANRTFAAFSLGQTVPVGEALTFDLSVDGNRTIAGGIALADVANPDHPATSGGHLGQDGSLGEDYTAYSAGAMLRLGPWSARTRAELRQGEFADRRALSAAVLRDLGDGKVAGGGVTWSRATATRGTEVTIADAALSLAWRPAASDFAMLGKLEFRSDEATGAMAGDVGPAGPAALTVDGDARSRRLILSTSTNWSPKGDGTGRRTEVGLFAAVRHDLDRVEGLDTRGTTLLGGLDLRIGLGERFELGGRATVRTNLAEGTTHFAIGPEIGVSPAPNTLVSIGYNVTGFRDRDFADARSTTKGLFATVRLKFDQDSFGFLGRGR